MVPARLLRGGPVLPCCGVTPDGPGGPDGAAGSHFAGPGSDVAGSRARAAVSGASPAENGPGKCQVSLVPVIQRNDQVFNGESDVTRPGHEPTHAPDTRRGALWILGGHTGR